MKKTFSLITVMLLALTMVVTSSFAVLAETAGQDNSAAQNEAMSAPDGMQESDTNGISPETAPDEMLMTTPGDAAANGPEGIQDGELTADQLDEMEVSGEALAAGPGGYTVKWMNGDTLLETDVNVQESVIPAYDGAEPVKAADAQYEYTFAGWSADPAAVTGTTADKLPPVTADATYYAVFSRTEKPHVHSFGAWTTTVSPTYFKEGTEVRNCSCGATESRAVPKLTAKKKWVKDGDKRYYFGSSGKPVKGWVKVKHYKSKTVKWCYFTQDGVYVKSVKKNTKNKWVKADGDRFYFTNKKKPAGYGFNLIRGKLYHMNRYGAVMYGRIKACDGKKYTTAKDGSISGLAYYKVKYKTFVLVDISEQRIWCYKNGKQALKSDVVTGHKGRHDTPTGTFSVRSKLRNINLVGPTWSSHVSYWMAFIGSSYGLHDATWRSSAQFSNHKTYKTNGSHGCINLRPKTAAKLFNLVKVGTPVIVQK